MAKIWDPLACDRGFAVGCHGCGQLIVLVDDEDMEALVGNEPALCPECRALSLALDEDAWEEAYEQHDADMEPGNWPGPRPPEPTVVLDDECPVCDGMGLEQPEEGQLSTVPCLACMGTGRSGAA